MCKVLEVSESGFYRFKNNLNKPSRENVLSAALDSILADSPYNKNYGVLRMQIALKKKGIIAGIRRITKMMQVKGLLHEAKRRPKGITKSTTEVEEKENLIKQDFTAEKPFTKLLTDITQIGCREGKLYISPIFDCFNGEILALRMRNNMKKELCVDTLKAAATRFPIGGAILHSDRGSQYTSEAFRQQLTSCGLTQSLSGVHHCYDNARMESFFATLKKDLLYKIPTYKMRMEDVKAAIFYYVFVYYNKTRIYTTNPDALPPAAYRALCELTNVVAA